VDHGPRRPLGESKPPACEKATITIIDSVNQGFARGCNLAAETAFDQGVGWVWFLNNDATIESDVLTRLMELAEAYPQVGLWGTHQRMQSRILGMDALPRWFDPPTGAAGALEKLPLGCHQLHAHETLSGASILISLQTWRQLGPWPDWCFLYYEDVAWCLKAHGLGIPLVLTPLEINHAPNTSTGRRSALTTYYGVRNRLLLHADHWPRRKGLRLLQSLYLLQKRFFQGRWNMLGPTFRGIVDASRGKRFMR